MLYIIAAVGKNNELGKGNKLIWHLPEDLKFFKEKTMYKPIVMGYNTFLSLNRLLPNRKHIVITSHTNLPEEVTVFNNIDDTLNYIKKYDEAYIIGGASIYKSFIDKVDALYLTEIDDSKEADVYFPTFDKDEFDRKVLCKHLDNDIKYEHVLYERKKYER